MAVAHKPSSSTPSTGTWDTRYEWKAILLLTLAFGLVGVDRFMIAPIFPLMAKELHLDYSAIGVIGGALSLAWGVSSIFMGGLSDRFGTKKVIVPAVIVFSILAGISGVATGMLSLIVIRAIIGVSEGAYTPAGIVSVLEAAKPSRQGLMLGLQQMALPFFGLALAPLFVGWLLSMGLHWRWAFALVTIPGIIIALFMAKVLRDPKPSEAALHTVNHDTSKHSFWDVFKFRNVPLNIIMFLGWEACEITFAILLPSYLTDVLKLSIPQMISVLAAFGIGATLGPILLMGLSDVVGRKPVLFVGGIGCLIMVFILRSAGASTSTLFILVLITCFFSQGLISLTALVATESVPVKLMSSASGVVIGVGEIFGGGIVPMLGGFVAKHFGLTHIFTIAMVGLVIGIVITLFTRETAPRKVAAAQAKRDLAQA
nr:MFS transporter [uncultured Holophaga sp.]